MRTIHWSSRAQSTSSCACIYPYPLHVAYSSQCCAHDLIFHAYNKICLGKNNAVLYKSFIKRNKHFQSVQEISHQYLHNKGINILWRENNVLYKVPNTLYVNAIKLKH